MKFTTHLEELPHGTIVTTVAESDKGVTSSSTFIQGFLPNYTIKGEVHKTEPWKRVDGRDLKKVDAKK